MLLTRFLDADGVAEVSEFMPVADAGDAHTVVRRAKAVRGEVRFQMRCEPRFDSRWAGPPRAARDGRRALGLELPGASGQPPHEGAGLVRVAEAHERVEGERRIADPGVAVIPVAPASEGYMGSRPVRVGNAAFDNLQLDIYGELMDSVYLYDKYGSPMGYDAWTNLVRLMDWLSANWHRPDEGIWEVRGGRQEFVFSRMMCWVAFDRAIRLATKRSFPAPLAKWYETRDRIFHDVFTRFWDAGRGAFVQHVGATTVDAATLLMPLVRFISPTDPRWISTLRAIEHELVSDSLVYRYRLAGGFSDGLTGEEGTFSMCSFWYVECLSRMGDLQQARFFFEKMLGYANHLGLYGEELGPQAQHLGNFPQAFTHLALISAAFDLDRRLSAAGHAG